MKFVHAVHGSNLDGSFPVDNIIQQSQIIKACGGYLAITVILQLGAAWGGFYKPIYALC